MKKNLIISIVILIIIGIFFTMSVLSSQVFHSSKDIEKDLTGTYIWNEASMQGEGYNYKIHFDKNQIYYSYKNNESELTPMGYWFVSEVPSYTKGEDSYPILVTADILLGNLFSEDFSGIIEFFYLNKEDYGKFNWNASFMGFLDEEEKFYVYSRAITSLSKTEQIERKDLPVNNKEIPDFVDNLEKEFSDNNYSWSEPIWGGGYDESTIYFYDSHRYSRYRTKEDSTGNEIISEGYWIISQTLPNSYSETEEENGSPILILFDFQATNLRYGEKAGKIEFFSIEKHHISGYNISLIGFYDGSGRLNPEQRGVISLQRMED